MACGLLDGELSGAVGLAPHPPETSQRVRFCFSIIGSHDSTPERPVNWIQTVHAWKNVVGSGGRLGLGLNPRVLALC